MQNCLGWTCGNTWQTHWKYQLRILLLPKRKKNMPKNWKGLNPWKKIKIVEKLIMKLNFAKSFQKGQFYITVIKDIILIFITKFEMWKINIVYLVTLYVWSLSFPIKRIECLKLLILVWYINNQPQHLRFGCKFIFIANYGKIIGLVIFFP